MKERILQFIENKQITKSKFYSVTGLSNGILDKKSGLTMDTVEKIYSKYPEINLEWLLTGKGEMLKSEHENQEPEVTIIKGNRKTRDSIAEIQEIPLYDYEATAGLSGFFNGDKSQNLLDTIRIPNAPICDGAIFVTGDSMYPLLKSGDIILYKEIPLNMDHIFFGEMYILGFSLDGDEENVVVKYVKKSEKGSKYIQLVSQNPHHAPKDIPFKSVRAMAIVKVNIRMNTMY